MKRSLIALAGGMAITLAAPGTAQAQDMNLVKIPKSYSYNGKVFSNLEGYIVNIPDSSKIEKYTTAYQGDLWCTQIHYSFVENGKSARNNCYTGAEGPPDCGELYNADPRWQPSSRLGQLAPFRPMMDYAATAHATHNTSKTSGRVIAINANFFNTKPFNGRDTDDLVWKPIFQEACGLNLGTFRAMRRLADGDFYTLTFGNFANRETDGEGRFGTGNTDRPFGTLFFKGPWSSSHGAGLNVNVDSNIQDDWPAMAGTYIRWPNSKNQGVNLGKDHSSVPRFVAANWAAKVGRTAIGFSVGKPTVRIIVIQPGAAEAKTGGVDVPTLQSLFDPAVYQFVLMLDGGGSSALAANFTASTIAGQATTTGRPGDDCIFDVVKTCTKRGNFVGKKFIEHWEGKDGDDDRFWRPGPDTSTVLVDRWIPNAFILHDPN